MGGKKKSFLLINDLHGGCSSSQIHEGGIKFIRDFFHQRF